MTQQTTAQTVQSPPQPDHSTGMAHGLAVFAGVIMIMVGAFQAFNGLVAVFKNEFYVSTPNYIFQFDVSRWGWIHLLLGVVILFAGIAVMSGRGWARVTGIILAGLSALANFAFIPYYPIWSLLIIALNVAVIWALSVYRPQH